MKIWKRGNKDRLDDKAINWNILKYRRTKRATARQNEQNDMCPQQRFRSAWASARSDQSSLCVLWVAKDPTFLHADSEDCSDWADAQVDLSHRWAYMWFCWFCHALTQMVFSIRHYLNCNYHCVWRFRSYRKHHAPTSSWPWRYSGSPSRCQYLWQLYFRYSCSRWQGFCRHQTSGKYFSMWVRISNYRSFLDQNIWLDLDSRVEEYLQF